MGPSLPADELEALERRTEGWKPLSPGGETILTGRITDQAALFGLLFRIRDLGIPLLSINEIEPDRAEVNNAGTVNHDSHINRL